MADYLSTFKNMPYYFNETKIPNSEKCYRGSVEYYKIGTIQKGVKFSNALLIKFMESADYVNNALDARSSGEQDYEDHPTETGINPGNISQPDFSDPTDIETSQIGSVASNEVNITVSNIMDLSKRCKFSTVDLKKFVEEKTKLKTLVGLKQEDYRAIHSALLAYLEEHNITPF